MFRNFVLFSTLLFLTSSLWSQSFTVKGYVYDAEDSSPLKGGYVGIRGGEGAYTGNDGFFELTLDDPAPLVLMVKYLGYVTQPIKVDPRSGKVLVINMVSEPVSLEPTLITDQALRKIHPDDALPIIDYAFIGDQYLMIVRDKEIKQNKLVLLGTDGKVLAEHYGFGEEPQSLVQDCMGTNHFLSMNQACQIDLVEGTLWVQKSKRREYDAVVTPCSGLLDDTYFFQDRWGKYGRGFYYVKANELVKRGFYISIDSASLVTIVDEGLMPSRYATTDKLDDAGRPGEMLTILNNNYLASVTCPTAFVPLHIVKGKVTIFDHSLNKIVRFDESMQKVKELPIDYHERRFWEPTLVVDEGQTRAFTVYVKYGKTTLAEISVEDGSILREFELPKDFVSQIKVKGDEVFFLYKDRLYDPVRRLYAFDMSW